MSPSSFKWLAVFLIAAKWAAQILLDRVNRRYVLARASAVPEAFSGIIEEAMYKKSVEYSIAKGRLHQVEASWNSMLLILLLVSGVLPGMWRIFSNGIAGSAWGMAGFVFLAGMALSLADLPLDWYYQFRLEERFGFNTTTRKTWWLDRLKGLL